MKIKLIFPKNFEIKIPEFNIPNDRVVIRETLIKEFKPNPPRTFLDNLFGFK